MTRPRPGARPTSTPSVLERYERVWAVALLALHAGLALWVARENSVTFDENFHVPAGVRILAARDFATSYAQPPLPKTLYGLAALAAGARDPGSAQAGPGRERFVGYAFMRANAARYQRVYFAARLVALTGSLVLAVLVWRAARSRYGPRAGLMALALWAILPETLAHAAIAGVDLPTALVFFGAALAWAAFLREGGVRPWAVASLWVAAAFLTRFSALQLFPALLAVTAVAAGRRALPRPSHAWVGLAVLPLVALVAIDLGYLLQVSFHPLAAMPANSTAFASLQRLAPGLRLPLPDAWLEGADYLASLSQPGAKHSFLLGAVTTQHAWHYFPVAVAVKWPIGLLGLVLARLATRPRGRGALDLDAATGLAVTAVVALSCLASNLDYGVRYLLPVLPFACVWVAGCAAAGVPRSRFVLAGLLVAGIAVESARALPYPLSFFNALVGGPGRGDRIVNDSNVDWGQGLKALRRELDRRGIARVHLAYHGTVDPALYGIDYVLYANGTPGPESDWLAVSSYFMVGLPARLTTRLGMSEESVTYDFQALRDRPPAARPAGCMYLFRIR